MEDDGRLTFTADDLGDISTEASIMAAHGAATAVMKTSSSDDEAEAAAAMGASKYTSPTRRQHGIAVQALKVVLASAAVSGAIWGLSSGAKRSAANDAAALLMNTSTKSSKTPVVKQAKSKAVSLRHAMFIVVHMRV